VPALELRDRVSDAPDDRQEPPADEADVMEAGTEESDWVEVEWLDDVGDSGFYGADDLDEDELLEDADGETVVFTYDATVRPGDEGMVELLRTGSVEVLGIMPWSSNGAYLVDVRSGDDHAPAVYKPEAGEQPLWDFPGGLWRREVASYDLSAAMGFDLVPPTVVRLDGPAGPGSLQAFVPAQFEHHYFTLREDPTHGDTFRRLCAFDLVANSTDRKGGHVPARRGRPDLGDRQRAHVPRRVQAADGPVGLRRGTDRRRRARRRAPPARRRLPGHAGPSWAGPGWWAVPSPSATRCTGSTIPMRSTRTRRSSSSRCR